MRGLITIAVLTALGAAGAPAWAAGGSIWDHNGSKMEFQENGDKRKLVYKELREGLDKAGIRQGTVLFNGEKKPNGRLAGFAKIFKGACNPIDYFVEGTLDEAKGEIVLQGQAPVYTSGAGCEVNGYSDSSPASTLRFAKISDAPDAAVTAERAPPPGIEQGDGGNTASNSDYLPPASGQAPATGQRERSASRTEEELPPAPRNPTQDGFSNRQQQDQPPAARSRPPVDESEVDEAEEEFLRQREQRRYGRSADEDRRYSRAPERNGEPPVRRRPGIWDPEDDEIVEEDEGFYNGYERRPPPSSPFWGRRPW